MESLKNVLFKRLKTVMMLFLFVFLVALGNKHNTVTTYYINNSKSLGSAHIVSKYDASVEAHAPILANNLAEVRNLAHDNGVFFYGTMTGYGPDCEGCGGKVGCAPYTDVRHTVYFNDSSYGQVRILASEPSIPCGTIIKFSNVTFTNEEVTAIVLDRGGAIKGTLFDFLVESEAAADVVGRQRNVRYEIQRWGW